MRKTTRKTTLTISIDPVLLDLIDITVERTGLSRSALVTRCLHYALTRVNLEALRFVDDQKENSNVETAN